jgi:type II restriction/modification system DNA methylase subunit YeeA
MGRLISDKYEEWKAEANARFDELMANEEELNRIFIDIYGLADELTPDVAAKDVTVHRVYDSKDDVPDEMKGSNYVLTKRDMIVSLISYAVGCMFGRYSLDVEGLAYAGGDWDQSKYQSYIPDADNVLPITDTEYLSDDIVTRFVDFIRIAYGEETVEENIRFIADSLEDKGVTAREVIRNYFLKEFYKDHVKTYKKRPIYWLFDSGKANGFKALIYLHRYTEDTVGLLRVEYLHKLQRIYEAEIARMQDTAEHAESAREISVAQKRLEKLQKQVKETTEYDEKIGHLANARISLNLDDGVKVNYEKIQTDRDGKKLAVLSPIK